MAGPRIEFLRDQMSEICLIATDLLLQCGILISQSRFQSFPINLFIIYHVAVEFAEMRWYHVSQRGPGLKRSGKMIPGLLCDFNTRLTWSRCFQRRAMAIDGKWECGGLVRTCSYSDWESSWRCGGARADYRQRQTGWRLDITSRLKTSVVVQWLRVSC